MRFDKPSLILAAGILLVSAIAALGGISQDMAKNFFILIPLFGFIWSRRQACRAGACA